ncbi:MAG: PTS sugar transporter subunit IIB [Elusimicrobiales bacterium]
MKIYRVDDRLIHGQVVENWLDFFSINCIVIVNDDIVSDELRKNIMRFAVPHSVNVFFIKTDELVSFRSDDSKNYLFLFENLRDVMKCIDMGAKIDRLNLGGIHFAHGRNFTLGKVVYLSGEECEILKRLISFGVDVYRQAIPQEIPVNVSKEI